MTNNDNNEVEQALYRAMFGNSVPSECEGIEDKDDFIAETVCYIRRLQVWYGEFEELAGMTDNEISIALGRVFDAEVAA